MAEGRKKVVSKNSAVDFRLLATMWQIAQGSRQIFGQLFGSEMPENDSERIAKKVLTVYRLTYIISA